MEWHARSLDIGKHIAARYLPCRTEDRWSARMILRPLFPLLCLALVAGAATVARQHRTAPPAVAAAPTNEREAWALALLSRLGNDAPTQDTVAFLQAWHRAE